MSRLLLLVVLLYPMLGSLLCHADDDSRPATSPSSAGIDINELEDYTQWKQALGAGEGTDPATYLVPPGFEIERLRSASPEEISPLSTMPEGLLNALTHEEILDLLAYLESP